MASKWGEAARAALQARFLSEPRANSANRSGTDRDNGPVDAPRGAIGTNGTIGTPRREREAPSIHQEKKGQKSFSYANRAISADSQTVGWTAEDWRVYYLERAAIREYDGGLTRDEADRRAWRETANRWWHEHGSRSAPGICCGCGKPVSLADAIPLPHDQRVHNADCMATFGRRWLKEAAEALAKMGVPTPAGYGPDEP